VSRFVVVASLKDGMRDRARALVAAGPPFDPTQTGLSSHEVHVSDREVVFVFEGPESRAAVERLAGDPAVWGAAADWRSILAGRPRIAEQVFGWSRDEPG
jgi:hypothetical protein